MNGASYEIAQQHLAKILLLKQSGDLLTAVEQINALTEEYPDFLAGWLELGRLHRFMGDRVQALEAFKAASKLNNGCISHLEVALEQIHLSQLDKAQISLNLALVANPNYAPALVKLGELYQQREDRQRAVEYFQKALDSEPNNLWANIAFADELRRTGALAEAEQRLLETLEHYPDHFHLLIGLAKIYQSMNCLDDAIAYYQKAANINPNLVWLQLKIAGLLRKFNRVEDAIALLENIPPIVSQTAQIQSKLGELYQSRHNSKAAMACFSKALEIDPTHLWPHLHMAGEFSRGGLFDEAKHQLLQALESHPQNLQVLLELGELEKRQQRIEEALAYYRQAQALYDDRPEPKLKTVQALMAANQRDQAISILHQLLDQYPSDHRVLMQWGYVERQQGHREKALSWFRQASDMASNSSQSQTAQLFAIDELQDLGRLEEAHHSIHDLLEQSPHDANIKMRLGKILQSQPDLTAAANIYNEVLAENPNHLQARIELARTLSQSSQINKAISLLTETYDLLGPTPQLLMLLGELAIAQDDWDTAHQWYKEAYQLYPFNPHCPIAFANVMVLQGKREQGLDLLKQAEQKMPHVVDIPLKMAQIHGQLGELAAGTQILQQLYIRFPDHVPVRLALARIYGQAGEFDQAQMLLDGTTSDRAIWKKQMEHLRGEMALQQYTYETAEYHFQNALIHAPKQNERDRLAITLMAMGKLDEAYTQLKLATEELELKVAPNAVSIPLIHHVAKVIQAFRIAPGLLAQLKTIQEESKEDQLLALGQLIIQNPYYIGSAITLAKELRHQGIFSQLRDVLPTISLGLPSIPRCIVQYWDASKPPKDVQSLTQTWQDQNPDYEYHRFSYQEALSFLDQHYSNDDRILKAFKNCDQPATQADFFRLAYLNKKGGFYADADDRCRKSLDILLERNPELVLLQEDFACIGNNLMGCIPGQTTVRIAFYQAVQSLLHYSADGPWFQTGPALLTCALGNTLLPYLSYRDYSLWPRIWVLSQTELRSIVTQHIALPYKRTAKSWSYSAYSRRVSRSTPQKGNAY